MTENLKFVPVDLRIHRSQLVDLNIEYMNWWMKGIEECFNKKENRMTEFQKFIKENEKL